MKNWTLARAYKEMPQWGWYAVLCFQLLCLLSSPSLYCGYPQQILLVLVQILSFRDLYHLSRWPQEERWVMILSYDNLAFISCYCIKYTKMREKCLFCTDRFGSHLKYLLHGELGCYWWLLQKYFNGLTEKSDYDGIENQRRNESIETVGLDFHCQVGKRMNTETDVTKGGGMNSQAFMINEYIYFISYILSKTKF